MARERCRLGADAFHQAAVAADGVDVVIEHLEARAVVAIGEPPLADRHADAGRDALAQRAGGRLHARHHAVFGMPGRLAAELTEPADVVERDRRLAQPLVVGIHGPRPGQVEHRPEQHRGVAVREHEAVAAGPDRILRIEAHDAIPEGVDQRRERHRRSGVPRVGRLDRIHRQRANGVDGELIHLRVRDSGVVMIVLSDGARRPLPAAFDASTSSGSSRALSRTTGSGDAWRGDGSRSAAPRSGAARHTSRPARSARPPRRARRRVNRGTYR